MLLQDFRKEPEKDSFPYRRSTSRISDFVHVSNAAVQHDATECVVRLLNGSWLVRLQGDNQSATLKSQCRIGYLESTGSNHGKRHPVPRTASAVEFDTLMLSLCIASCTFTEGLCMQQSRGAIRDDALVKADTVYCFCHF
jgi:hypothetical protein